MQNPRHKYPMSSNAPIWTIRTWMFLALSKSIQDNKIGSGMYQRPMTISKLRSRCQTSVRTTQRPSKSQIRTQRTWIFFSHSKSRERAKIQNIGVSKSSDHIKKKIKMLNSSQEHTASSKAQNEDPKDMDVLCTF